MGIIGWFKKKSYEKSTSNIIDGIRPLVAAVRADVEGSTRNLDLIAKLGGEVEQGREPKEAEVMDVTESMERWRTRKRRVVEAQKKLHYDIALWSSLPPERSFGEVILPVLLSGQLVAPSEPWFDPVIVAVYRVCEAVAKQNGVDLEPHTPPEILQKVKDAGDLYKIGPP
jgi:hypothetical protein